MRLLVCLTIHYENFPFYPNISQIRLIFRITLGQKSAAIYDYHIQAALYADLIEKSMNDDMPWTFIFIAQEKKAPYAFNIFEASTQFISHGRYEYELLLMLYKHCSDSGKWPGYQVFCENKFGINELSLPPWAIREIDWFIH